MALRAAAAAWESLGGTWAAVLARLAGEGLATAEEATLDDETVEVEAEAVGFGLAKTGVGVNAEVGFVDETVEVEPGVEVGVGEVMTYAQKWKTTTACGERREAQERRQKQKRL